MDALKSAIATLLPTSPPETNTPTRPTIKRNRKAEARIVDGMVQTFNLQELIEFAADVGLDYETILGEGLRGKIMAFVAHFGRHGHIDILVNQLTTERPHVDWLTMLLDTSELK